MPEFYNTHMKVALFFAPPAAMKSTTAKILYEIAHHGLSITVEFIEILHAWNLIPYHYDESKVTSYGCGLFDGNLCNWILESFCDKNVLYDDTERYPVFFSFVPSGEGYKNFAHYAQLCDQETEVFRRYDEGKAGN